MIPVDVVQAKTKRHGSKIVQVLELAFLSRATRLWEDAFCQVFPMACSCF